MYTLDSAVKTLLSAAHGLDPAIQPYQALIALNQIKQRVAQAPQQGQNPTVLDQDVNAIMQAAAPKGLPSAMPTTPAAPAAGGIQSLAPQTMPAAQPTAAPEPVPAQEAPTQEAANGGIMSLPVRTSFRDGGIVTFAAGEDVEDDNEAPDDEDDELPPITPPATKSVKGAAPAPQPSQFQLANQATNAQLRQQAPTTDSQLEIQKQMMAQDPENYGILGTKPGAQYLKDFQAFQEHQAAQDPATQAANERMNAIARGNMLIGFGEGTRGTGNLLSQLGGGFRVAGTVAGRAVEEQEAREKAMRDAVLSREHLMVEAKAKVEDLQRAQAEGDVSKVYQNKLALAKLANQLHISQNTLLGHQLTSLGSNEARRYAADKTAEAKLAAQRLANAKPEKATDYARTVNAYFDDLVGGGADPKDPSTMRLATERAAKILSKTAGTARVEETSREKADDFIEGQIMMRKELRKDPAAQEEFRKKIYKQRGIDYTPDAETPSTSSSSTGKPSLDDPKYHS